MNFLNLRSNSFISTSEQPKQKAEQEIQTRPTGTLEGLIDEDPFPPTPPPPVHRAGFNSSSRFGAALSANSNTAGAENHVDVTEDQGWITIPYKELPENWMEAPDILSFESLDRSFVFPGEQVHVLACLSPYKHDTETITPFKVAAMMNKNGIGRIPKIENGKIADEPENVSSRVEVTSDGHDNDQNGVGQFDFKKDASHGESLLRMENQKRQTETLLQSFRNSHFFVRIADSHKSLWSRRRESGASAESSSATESFDGADIRKTEKKTSLSASVDRGGFDASSSGGMARNSIECCALSNGDIVVLLQVNVGVDLLKDPVLEILQFEKYEEKSLSLEKPKNVVPANEDPCGDLLKWLLPLDNSISPPSRPLSPPPPSLSSSSSIRTTSSRPNSSASSTSQMFSFGNFRSYSMSALPPNNPPPPTVAPNPKPNFDTEDWNQFSYKSFGKPDNTGNEGLLSFRGVSLEPERFSVCCGLEGIYIPGNRWRRKIEIIQPLEIHSFAAECNTEDLLCVQIKNVSPAHTPEIMVYLDAIMIIFEKASKGGPPLSVPIACIEAGTDHCLPNLALRRGEEHSFILKPATSMWKTLKVPSEKNTQPSHSRTGSVSTSFQHPNNVDQTASNNDQYAVLVSCRCNYTESRLFFKQPTSWRPHISRDVLISVASEMSKQTLVSNGRVPQLPVQVLTLQASNLTSEDLTMTVLAPASFMHPPSVLSLNPSPRSPLSPYVGSSGFAGRFQETSSLPVEVEIQKSIGDGGPSFISSEQLFAMSDVLPRGDLGCTHLWLQSRVPLGCVPARSTATIKLELLPLTDGIITLDSLQINIKEKGQTYIPEYSLKINATSSVATGIK
ncbi:hypothetical protein DCAR_0832159 [Daucus carota subsp. sativus]|uniref:Uncharacterized protein n=1 Tax=Daucus carota subsp. sativus TaxID=79200 RepID=A0AAF1BD35_DAUCS|nr:hypothetical protein DCAR_0832159 [Daucus carota subsp. sativus]